MWKEIKGYEGLYWINENGEIKNKKGNIRKPSQSHGYNKLRLTKDKKVKNHYVHILLAQTFIPNNENKKYVNHKDCNKINNVVKNLEWVSNQENLLHGIENNGTKRYIVNLIDINSKKEFLFESLVKASKFLGYRIYYLQNKKNDCGNKFKIKNKAKTNEYEVEIYIKKKQ